MFYIINVKGQPHSENQSWVPILKLWRLYRCILQWSLVD